MIYNKVSINFFKSISEAQADNIKFNGEIKKYEKEELLFMQGDRSKFIYIVISGWAKLFRTTFDGQEVVLGLASEGDIIGESDLYNLNHSFGTQVVTGAHILRISSVKLKEIIQDDSDLSYKLILALNSYLSMLELQIEHSSTMNAAQRIGCLFIKLSGYKSAQGSVSFTLPFNKILLAAYLGMKRETFSRGLKELTEIGVKTKGSVIYIKEIQILIQFTCVSCSLFNS